MLKSDGLYRRCLVQLLDIGPEKAIKLYVYKLWTDKSKNNTSDHIISGLFAGTCQVMIKINMQMNNNINYGGG